MTKRAAPNAYAKVFKSGVHGRGMVAKRFIPAGTRIIEYVGDKITKAESDRRAQAQIQKGKRYNTGAVYIFELNQRHDIDGNVSWNPARLINHSCAPNCETDIIRGHIWIIAERDIQPGEELNYDYGFGLDDWEDHPCRCGSENCCGYIVAKRLRWRVLKKLAERG